MRDQGGNMKWFQVCCTFISWSIIFFFVLIKRIYKSILNAHTGKIIYKQIYILHRDGILPYQALIRYNFHNSKVIIFIIAKLLSELLIVIVKFSSILDLRAICFAVLIKIFYRTCIQCIWLTTAHTYMD